MWVCLLLRVSILCGFKGKQKGQPPFWGVPLKETHQCAAGERNGTAENGLCHAKLHGLAEGSNWWLWCVKRKQENDPCAGPSTVRHWPCLLFWPVMPVESTTLGRIILPVRWVLSSNVCVCGRKRPKKFQVFTDLCCG